MPETRVITLTTDFGLQDPFVGIMHGVVLSIQQDTRIVDISHAVRAFDVLDGAFTIAQAYRYFPPRTVHVIVVDPGVGSERRAIVAETDDYLFVAPDNGVLTLVETRESRFKVRHITAERYFLQPVSQTFHGRDIFSPVSAWLAKGISPADMGPEIADYVRLAIPRVQRSGNEVRGTVLKVDKFGNVITNLTEGELGSALKIELRIAGRGITRFCRSYAEGGKDELFAVFGSSGYLEIAAKQDSAARKLGVKEGEPVSVLTAG